MSFINLFLFSLFIFQCFCEKQSDNSYHLTSEYCQENTVVNSPSGEIRSHTVPGGYLNNRTCTWSLKKTGNYLVLNYIKFKVEYGFDFLSIYDETSPPKLIVAHSGSVLPQPEQFSISGPSARITFSTDSYVTDDGFILDFNWTECKDRCNGHGSCVNGKCNCTEPWSGETCASGGCNNNCNHDTGNGECIDGKECQCTPGYSGYDCSVPYCNGLQYILKDSGTIASHRTSGSYLNNQKCTWIIKPEKSQDSISLSFISFALDFEHDFVTVFDGDISNTDSAHIPILLGKFSGNKIPYKVYSFLGALSVIFTSDYKIVSSGFEAEFQSFKCEKSCSDNGVCYSGTCHCDVGKTGPSCSQDICHYNCSYHGDCKSNKCVCDQGFSGDACSICDDLEYCDQGFCSQSILFANTGQIESQEGPTYSPSANCSWFIDLTAQDVDVVEIYFYEFDLHPNYAEVIVWDKPRGNIISVLTGYQKYRTLYVQGKSAYIQFENNSTDVLTGFKAEYKSYGCLNSCSGRGQCQARLCNCDRGWTGMDCSESECLDNCNGGICSSENKCVCPEGSFGVSCETHFCSGVEVLVTNEGTVSDHDHNLNDQYLPNSNCTFIIRPENGAETGITFLFTFVQIESNKDSVVVIDPYYRDLEVDGSFAPPPRSTLSSEFTLHFTTDSVGEWAGFTAYWSANNLCPESCSGHGHCIQGTCYCDGDREGVSCAREVVPIEIQFRYFTIDDSVLQWRWKVYKYEARQWTKGILYLRIKTFSEDNMLLLFANRNSAPTLQKFQLYSPYAYRSEQNLGIIMQGGEIWYFGVYGLQGNSDFTIEFVDERSGYLTSTGTIPGDDTTNASNSDILWGALVICVLVVIFTVTTLVVLQYQNSRKKNSNEIQMEQIPSESSRRDESVSNEPHSRGGYAQFDIGSDYKD